MQVYGVSKPELRHSPSGPHLFDPSCLVTVHPVFHLEQALSRPLQSRRRHGTSIVRIWASRRSELPRTCQPTYAYDIYGWAIVGLCFLLFLSGLIVLTQLMLLLRSVIVCYSAGVDRTNNEQAGAREGWCVSIDVLVLSYVTTSE
jgi:hypothetical protein